MTQVAHSLIPSFPFHSRKLFYLVLSSGNTLLIWANLHVFVLSEWPHVVDGGNYRGRGH